MRASTIGLITLIAATAGHTAEQKGVYGSLELTEETRELVTNAAEIYGEFESRGLLFRDSAVNTWVTKVGERIKPEPADPYIDYRFALLHNPVPNAFALPNGQIYIHTGILARLENEAQLAALLAHEINHVAGHHPIVHYEAYKRTTIAVMVVGPIVGAVTGGWGALATTLVDLGFSGAILGYSRTLEEEADRRALDLMLAAGYDVRELPELYRLMAEDPEGEMPRIPTFWSTHPQLLERALHTGAMVDALRDVDFDQLTLGELQYSERIRNLRVMTVEDYIDFDYPRSALALAQKLRKIHLGDTRVLVAVGDAWAALGPRSAQPDNAISESEKRKRLRARERYTREEREAQILDTDEGRTNLADNMSRATAAYQEALAIDPSTATAYRGLGWVYEHTGFPKKAARAYLRYLKAAPDARDRELVLDRLDRIARDLRGDDRRDDETERG